MNIVGLSRRIAVSKGVIGVRGFAAGGAKSKKGSKGGAGDAPKASALSNELKSTTVFGANIIKDGADPKILPDTENSVENYVNEIRS
ncbi:hypothetical protein J5N97_025851 [Dioscorea zingiberensis]|uniref:Large ribosomal subunit protein mL54 n=1 Tax=Dioscorea zingiberensis TaxID=325984 RepID=A0A9D5H645_9LILI|nr:hypothetical protein J5N97_025851 [Dioscorea zingiberensis]